MTQWRIQDFPGRQPIIWQIFCQKLHENESNWTGGGGGGGGMRAGAGP